MWAGGQWKNSEIRLLWLQNFRISKKAFVIVSILIRFYKALVLGVSSHFLTKRRGLWYVCCTRQSSLSLSLPLYFLLLGWVNAPQGQQGQSVAFGQRTDKAKMLDGAQKKSLLHSLLLQSTTVLSLRWVRTWTCLREITGFLQDSLIGWLSVLPLLTSSWRTITLAFEFKIFSSKKLFLCIPHRALFLFKRLF